MVIVGKYRIADADRNQLVVFAFVVVHSHDADSADVRDGERNDRFLIEYRHIQEIPSRQ
jgi:hypothetical protein